MLVADWVKFCINDEKIMSTNLQIFCVGHFHGQVGKNLPRKHSNYIFFHSVISVWSSWKVQSRLLYALLQIPHHSGWSKGVSKWIVRYNISSGSWVRLNRSLSSWKCQMQLHQELISSILLWCPNHFNWLLWIPQCSQTVTPLILTQIVSQATLQRKLISAICTRDIFFYIFPTAQDHMWG